MTKLFAFWAAHRAELATLGTQHIFLVAVATAAAIAIGVPLGVFAARRPRLAAPLVGAASIVQTIPSLALFGFLLPVPLLGGIGARAAIVALILYGLLPIVRTTIAGIHGILPSIREAAVAMGMTTGELLRQVELPLALPSIVAGIRVAAVAGVGSATIAAAIGAGGLGEYIYRGLSMVDTTVILAGAVPAAAIALVVDGGLWWLERRLSARRRVRPARTLAAAAALVAALLLTTGLAVSGTTKAIVVGSKSSTEQIILGELLAQTIEAEAGLPVERKLNLGGTLICDRALTTGALDVYVEYTGTSLTTVFHQPVNANPQVVFDAVRELYGRSGRTLLPGLGFDSTFAILVRGRDARARNLRTIEDAARVAPALQAGFGYEFLDRPDGYSGLAALYGLRFRAPPRAMDLTLTYRALAEGQVDLIAGDSTAGLIKGLDLVQLQDNRHYFPPYDAAPVGRAETLLRHPEVRSALERLAGRISPDEMREMNYAGDVEHRDIAAIVREFRARSRAR